MATVGQSADCPHDRGSRRLIHRTFASVALIAGVAYAACDQNPVLPPPASNEPPILERAFADHQVFGGEDTAIPLADHFADPNGDLVRYVVESENGGIATVRAAGDSLVVTGIAEGVTMVSVTAMDSGGLLATGTFALQVEVNPDRAVLRALYRATDGPNWQLSHGWLTHKPLRDWYGVGTDSLGRVTDLILRSNNLAGTIPVELVDLSQLKTLVLSVNQYLTGPIPPELGDLAKLETLALDTTRLAGPIPPELGKLSYLKTLSLSRTELTGSIPPELANLSALETLNLRGRSSNATHHLTGPIPPELGKLANLTTLDLSRNHLTGTIPPELGNLASLEVLMLYGDQLTGPIPPELGKLANLTTLHLSGNHLTSTIPPESGSLASLETLSLSGNQLTGPIPAELANLTNLTTLHLSGNRLTEPIPPELGNLTSLEVLDLDGNQLTGPIPPELGKLANLTTLHLSGNHLTGTIPPESGSLASLETLSLSGNQLTGPIPAELANLTNLKTLNLRGNQLAGPIPPELQQLSALTTLGLQRNLLTGTVPAGLANLANLETLILSHNRLAGPIPPEVLGMSNLQRLGIASNAGLCIPGTERFEAFAERHRISSWCNQMDQAILKALYDASGGKDWRTNDGWLDGFVLGTWSGVMTDSLGRVTTIDLVDNGLAGELPSLGLLSELTELKLGRNPSLAGRLPLSLAQLSMSVLDFGGTGLCAPNEAGFQSWMGSVKTLNGTGRNCEILSDRNILEAVYRTADGPNWENSKGWLTDAPLGEWHGVTVDSLERVTEIVLFRAGGPIPPELGNLSELRVLDLCCHWTGTVPTAPENLSKLERLVIRSDGQLSISPTLAILRNLRELRLSSHHVVDGIPPELGDLPELRRLELCCELPGPIPPEFGTLPKLEDLSLRMSASSIPAELGNLPALQRLVLHGATGPIPPALGNLSALQYLYLNNGFNPGQLTGSIPPSLGNLSRLRALGLAENQLTGIIPPELGNLSALQYLHLNDNQLTGPIPAEFGNLTNLEQLRAWDNQLTGPIPPEIGRMYALTELGLYSNRLTGPIPAELGNLARLPSLDLHDNQLTGPIPAELGQMSALTALDISNNRLTGTIPAELGQLSYLYRLNFADNQLTGAIPADLGNLSRLYSLNFADNQLTGSIPSELGTMPALTGLYLSDNQLTGSIPPELGNLESLNLSHNHLTGTIPAALGKLARLTSLSLADNSLAGTIPPDFGRLSDLYSLNLAHNQLTGGLPLGLSDSNLGYLYLNDNDGLCVPGTESFITLHTRRLGRAEFSWCNERDVALLKSLYKATGGSAWSTVWQRSDGWQEGIRAKRGRGLALDSWYGVTADSLGRVTGLNLSDNGLVGWLPDDLGTLEKLVALNVAGNSDLGGRLPLSLTDLSMETLDYAGTTLCAPAVTAFQSWLASIGTLNSTGRNCGVLSDRDILESFYRATDGPNWRRSDQWLTDAPLGEWYGVEVGQEDRVTRLDLSYNNLTGSIPPELGHLSGLRELNLSDNALGGPIPASVVHLNIDRRRLRLPDSLCWPGVREVVEWLGASSSASFCNWHDLRVLREFFEATGAGVGWSASQGWHGNTETTTAADHVLGDWHGVETDSLGRVTDIDLNQNGLHGTVPHGLGTLGQLTRLVLADNPRLEGALPLSMSRLSLRAFDFSGTGLCVPANDIFMSWLREIASVGGTGTACAKLSDRDILEVFYHATAPWLYSDNWLTDAPLGDWYGVSVDTDGRVTRLDLRNNWVRGPLPDELGLLDRLTIFNLPYNRLSGPIPPAMGNLKALEELVITGDSVLGRVGSGGSFTVSAGIGYNRLTGSIPRELGNLTNLRILNLNGNALSGEIPAELGNLTNLEFLDLAVPINCQHAPAPKMPDGWTPDRVLRCKKGSVKQSFTGAIPPELGKLTKLKRLYLYNNNLTGPIPPELGNLTNLEELALQHNDLTGIPPELGNLSSLKLLRAYDNDLAGPIPGSLGNASNLEQLWLHNNELTSIPPELGNLSELRYLYLFDNDLAGPIPEGLGSLDDLRHLDLYNNALTTVPADLGDLVNLDRLYLHGNEIAGPIPPALGSLRNLERLWLQDNRLSGPVPSQLGELSRLRWLDLTGNEMLEGPLPESFTALDYLDVLVATGTGVCGSPSDAFQSWLNTVERAHLPTCFARHSDRAAAYLVQAVQDLERPVPLVAGRDALLRVFVAAPTGKTMPVPSVSARFYDGAREVYRVDIPGKPAALGAELFEASLDLSANSPIPGEVIRPGLEMVIEIDREGALDPSLAVPPRIPAEGRMALDVRAVPTLEFTVVPFLWTDDPDSSVVVLANEMAADPKGHELLGPAHHSLPIPGMAVTAHPPVWVNSSNAYSLLSRTAAIRAMEGGRGYWQGMMKGNSGGVRGVAYQAGWVSFSRPEPVTIVHEIGHNMSLWHAPCGYPDYVDPVFPYENGGTGVLGYYFPNDQFPRGRPTGGLVGPGARDFMGYCNSPWVSDYHFTNALRHRLRAEPPPASPATALLLWGGADGEGAPYLEPAFVLDAPPALPDSAGSHRIAGYDADGRELFSLDFALPMVADVEDQSSSFAFVLPVRPGWEALAVITLTAPDGSTATLDRNSELPPMTILRDGSTGQIRAILGGDEALAADAPAPMVRGQNLVTLTSRGLPPPASWRR